MARVHGKNANYSFNAISIEDELSSITQTSNVPSSEITSFTDAYGVSLAGKVNTTTEISGSLDMTQGASAGDQTLFEAIGGGVVTTVFDPVGGGPAAGNPTFNCTASGLTGALVSNYSISLPVGDKASYSASIQHSGATTRAVA